MLVQTQSAKLGIATGKNLAELCRERFSRRTSSASGCRPSWWRWRPTSPRWSAPRSASTCSSASRCSRPGSSPAPAPSRSSACSSWATAGWRRGSRVLVGVVVASFVFELFDSSPDGGEVAKHLFVPGFAGTESILLATGIIGATVMPHVVYLHSALTQRRIVGRDSAEKKKILGFEKVDVVIALSLAGLVNLSMMIVAAALFHDERPDRRRLDRRRLRRASSSSSPTAPRPSSGSPCWPPASPPPRSGRWPARW